LALEFAKNGKTPLAYSTPKIIKFITFFL
jgi:hypothetical protein